MILKGVKDLLLTCSDSFTVLSSCNLKLKQSELSDRKKKEKKQFLIKKELIYIHTYIELFKEENKEFNLSRRL